MSQRNPNLYIAASDLEGRGVFCAESISEGEIIEICPVLILPKGDQIHIEKTKLYHYYFIWGEQDESIGIVLGFGSLYNHSADPNAEYYPDVAHDSLKFYALKDIPAGEEILVNYNGNPEDRKRVWFEKD